MRMEELNDLGATTRGSERLRYQELKRPKSTKESHRPNQGMGPGLGGEHTRKGPHYGWERPGIFLCFLT